MLAFWTARASGLGPASCTRVETRWGSIGCSFLVSLFLVSCDDLVFKEPPSLAGPFAVVIVDPLDATKPKRLMVRRREALDALRISAEPGAIYVMDYACEVPCQFDIALTLGSVDLRRRDPSAPLSVPESNRVYVAQLTESALSDWVSVPWPPPVLNDFDLPVSALGRCRCEASVNTVELVDPDATGYGYGDFVFASPVGRDYVAVGLGPRSGRTETSTSDCDEWFPGRSALYLVRTPDDGVTDGVSAPPTILHRELAGLLVDGERDGDVPVSRLHLLDSSGEFHSYDFDLSEGVLSEVLGDIPKLPVDVMPCFQRAEMSSRTGHDILLLLRDRINGLPAVHVARLFYLAQRHPNEAWVPLDTGPSSVREYAWPAVVWIGLEAYITGYGDPLVHWDSSRSDGPRSAAFPDDDRFFAARVVPNEEGLTLLASPNDGLSSSLVLNMNARRGFTPLISIPLPELFDFGWLDDVLFVAPRFERFRFFGLARAAEICPNLADRLSLQGEVNRAFRLGDRLVRVVYNRRFGWSVDFVQVRFGADEVLRCKF